MRYLCLGYYDPARFDELSADERDEMIRACRPLDDELHASGRLLTVASLAHREAAALRPDGDGGTTVTDGPYAEAKEVVGSFFVIEADDMEDAVRVASLHPAARWGRHLGFGVEVLPIEYWRSPEHGDERGEPPA